MASFPSASLPPDIAARLIAEWDRAHHELCTLLKSVSGRGFRHAGQFNMRGSCGGLRLYLRRFTGAASAP